MCIGSALSSTLQFAERHASLRPLPASIIRPIFIIFASRRPIDTYNHSPALIVIALSYIWTGCSWFHFFADADSWNRSLDASYRPDSIFGSPAALGSARALEISLYEWRHRNFPLPGARNSHVPGGSLASVLLCARTQCTSAQPDSTSYASSERRSRSLAVIVTSTHILRSFYVPSPSLIIRTWSDIVSSSTSVINSHRTFSTFADQLFTLQVYPSSSISNSDRYKCT